MTATLQPTPATRSLSWKNLSPLRRASILWLGGLLIFSIVRIIADADDITSSGTISSTLRVATPILLAGLAGLWAERAGIVNIGIEGMMIIGSWCGGYGAWKWGSWGGIALALVGGMLVGLLHALATVRFNVDHVVSGIAINTLAAGSTEYLSIIFFKGQKGGGESQSPPGKGGYGEFDMPFLAGGRIGNWKSPDILKWFEDKHDWPLIPDMAGFVRGLVSDVYLPTILAIAIIPLSVYVLWRTRWGLRLRSSGESPQAGESLGVSINRLRYQAMAISGALAAFGGAYLSCVFTSTYRQGQTGGQGFIGLATTIFGNWQPWGVFRGSLLFGFPTALKFRDERNVPALLLVAAVALVIVALVMVLRRRSVIATSCLAAAVCLVIAYNVVDKVPSEFVAATPYIVTVIVLAGARQQLRPPAHAGLPYRPGESH
ncbi:MAG: ABC transporter permease [Acidimicrobiales bacterium mtb01]|nr:ABC transporter permease [Actinomycetota bacterium]TEX45836.1 MAG: ABC transporter permease [Acidimicrobiales bacterium mtb01]